MREGDAPLALAGAKQRALLAILLLNANRIVSSERLSEALWEDEPPDTAQKALQVHVSQLRKLLGRDRLQTKAPGYLLRVEPDELDLARFERLQQEGRLHEALSLWRGAPLAEFAQQRFARSEIARLEELRLSCIEERVERDLAAGRHNELIAELERLVNEQPLRERLRGQLMLALYRSGRQAEALEVYRDGRRTLVDELGLEPGRALQDLEGAILRRDPGLDAPVKTEAREERQHAAPVGTVTFLFTDIEGSTGLVERLGEKYGEVRADHSRLLRAAFAEHGGHEIDTQGDAFFVAFRRARDAVSAAIAAQRSLSEHAWPEGNELRVRMGIHTDEPSVAAEGYHGLGVIRAARICAAGHGGEILVSDATRPLIDHDEQFALRDLGEHRLKGLNRPERIYQLLAPGLEEEFPPLRTLDGAPLSLAGREQELEEAARAALERPSPRLSRSARWLAAAAAVLLVGSVAAALVEIVGGKSPRLVLGPNTLGVIDPRSNRVIEAIAVGDTPTSVAIGPGAVWVLNANEQTLSRVDPASRTVVKTIPAGESPTDVAVGAGSVWVVSAAFMLEQIDPGSGSVLRATKLPERQGLLGVGGTTPWLAATHGDVWATGKGSLARIAPPGLRVFFRNVGCCDGIAIGYGSVWVTNDAGVARLDLQTGVTTAQIRLPFSPSHVAVGAGAAWIVDSNGNALWAIDPRRNQATRTITVGSNPQDVAVGEGAVWVASADGTVARVDPRTDRVVKRVSLGGTPSGIAVGHHKVWVSLD